MGGLEAAVTILTALVTVFPDLKVAIESIIEALNTNSKVSEEDLSAILERIDLERQRAIASENVLLEDK